MNVPLFRRRRMGGATLSLSAQVAAILAGTTGFALDPSDLSTLWQDDLRTTPVTTSGQTVGCIDGKWGTIQPQLIQATAANRPAWNGAAGLTLDGLGDILASGTVANLLSSAAGAFLCSKNTCATNRTMINVRDTTGPLNRVTLGNTGGTAFTAGASTDAVSQSVLSSIGSDGFDVAVRTALWDYANGDVELRQDGAVVQAAALTGAVGALPSGRNAQIFYGHADRAGSLGRLVFLPFVPTLAQIETIEAWVGETAL